jgi:peptidoglycan/xylan/chitin deacetylase (PgdA/CDA1 family)
MSAENPDRTKSLTELRVFMYHSVGIRKIEDLYGLTVSKDVFKEQITFLIDQDVSFIKLDNKFNKFGENAEHTVALTFDDGYKDNLNAAEVLIDNSIPFSIYCIAEKVGAEDFLSFRDLRELHATGLCTVGGHGMTHQRLGDLSDEHQNNELRACREILEQGLGAPVDTMSLPHGSHNSRTLKFAQSHGYKLVCSSRPGINLPGNFNPFHVRRTEIRSADSLSSFIDKVRGTDDWRSYVYLGKSLLSWALDAQWARYR